MRCFEPLQTLNRKLLLFLLLFALAFGQNSIVLKKSVEARSKLTLADIAVVHIHNPQLAKYVQQIPIDIKYAEDNYISKDEVYRLLKKNFLDIKKIVVQGEGSRILYSKKEITKNDIIAAVVNFIKSHYKNIKVERIYLSLKKIQPKGEYTLRVLPTSDTFNHIYFIVKIYDARGLAKRVNVNVKVSRYAPLCIAKRFIPKGAIITERDIMTKRMKIKNAHIKPLQKEDIVGAIARQNIATDKIIKEYMIVPNFPVKKNKNVKIVYNRGGIYIELLGIALENGQIGDIIRVKNLSSNKVLQCKVISNGLVQYLY